MTPVFALKASSTFWNDACSLPPQSDVTVIVLPAAAVPEGVGVPVCAQAVITIEKANAIAARGRVDRIMAHLLCGLVHYPSRARASGSDRGEPGGRVRHGKPHRPDRGRARRGRSAPRAQGQPPIRHLRL